MKKRNEFIDDEAELSGDDEVSEDELEQSDDDQLDPELVDNGGFGPRQRRGGGCSKTLP